jgi:hypothetical protein
MELDPHDAPGRLFADMYRDLRQLAERQLRRNSWLTVSATTLLHEAYIGMSDSKAIFPDEARFIGYAARVMRGVIIDLVRERRALKRGAGFHITRLPTEVDVAAAPGFAADGQAAGGPAAFDPAAGDPAAGDRRARPARTRARRTGRPALLLRLHLRRDRRAARHLETHRPAGLGEGPTAALQRTQ